MEEAKKVELAVRRQMNLTAGQFKKMFSLDYFTYVINFLPLAASNNDSASFLTNSDAGFAICKTCFEISSNVNVYVANISDTPRFAPITITLSDSGSGRDLSNLPVAIGSLFGPDNEPFVWATPKILDPNSTLLAKVNNLVATAFNIRLSFHGYKIFGDIQQYRSLKA